MTLGSLIYKFFYKPTLPLRYYLKHFGLAGWFKMAKGERKMKKEAKVFSPIHLSNDYELEVCYLTGENYWHQTIFCAYSLARIMNGKIKIRIYSDSTLKAEQATILQQIFPGISIISEKQVVEHLDQFLTEGNFPTLRFLRTWHPFFKRLIDIHSFSSWSIHLDSDMLFFSRPIQLIEAYNNKRAAYMNDLLEQSYFADEEMVLHERFNISCKSNVNGGIIAYNNDMVDYVDLEAKAKLLLSNYPLAGPAQIEQTLMSYVLYKQNAEALDKKKYTIFFDSKITIKDTQIVRHYIFKAKLPYFTSEWKTIIH